MAATVRVTLLDAQAAEALTEQIVRKGTTIQEFLDLNRVNTARMKVSVRQDGEDVDYDLNDQLVDGTRITVTPTQIKGA